MAREESRDKAMNAMTTKIEDTPTQQIAADLLESSDKLAPEHFPEATRPFDAAVAGCLQNLSKSVARLLGDGEKQTVRVNGEASVILQTVVAVVKNPKTLHIVYITLLALYATWTNLRMPAAPAVPVATLQQQDVSAARLARMESLLTNVMAHVKDVPE